MTVPAEDRPALVKSSDGPISIVLNRRVSQPISRVLAPAGVSPNAATVMSLVIGAAAALAFAMQWWWLGGLLAQFSSIFAGVDGEIARRTGRGSVYGDFLDTVSDRFVEYATLVAIGYGLSQAEAWEAWAWPLAAAALGGSFMLAAASEKYRSVMHENYPKRQLEPLFAYLVSGRDVRVFYLAVASVAATWRVEVLVWALALIAVLMHLNWLFRLAVVRRRMTG